MLDCQFFFNSLIQNNVTFYTGVPDSLLKNICAYITDHSESEDHIITPNEGNAIALASGYHLATKKVPLVYMQNSGLGNCVNPLTSLTDPEVYGIPMVLLIGWRGEPDVKDEPQHVKMGRITPSLLDVMEIPYEVLPSDNKQAEELLKRTVEQAVEASMPVAILVKKGTFSAYNLEDSKDMERSSYQSYQLGREDVIHQLMAQLPNNARIVATTGKISREVYEYRKTREESHHQDFLTVGAMGHASHIALGLALNQSNKMIFCFDGDGAALMHLGSLATGGVYGPPNFKHIILNNASHDSVGGQPTMANQLSFPDIAKACGYESVYRVTKQEELLDTFDRMTHESGSALLEITVTKGARQELVRPQTTPCENKRLLMEAL